MKGCFAAIFWIIAGLSFLGMCGSIYGCVKHEKGASEAAILCAVAWFVTGAIASALSGAKGEGSGGSPIKNPVSIQIGGRSSGCIIPLTIVLAAVFVIAAQSARATF